MFGACIIVSFIFLAGTSYGAERCNCNMVRHRQNEFCNSTFAIHGNILESSVSPAPGVVEIGYSTKYYAKYAVEVLENFKGDNTKGTIIDIYSPMGGICGRVQLFEEDSTNEYLFLGDTNTTEHGVTFLVTTNCNWVERWENVLDSQLDGLRGMYTDCTCLAFPVSGPMEVGSSKAEKFSYDDCLFNPVKAEMLKVADCETKHGYCLRQFDNTCRWADTDAFQQCFQLRKTSLSVSAGAVRTKEECKLLYQGRKRRQCLLKFIKSRNSAVKK